MNEPTVNNPGGGGFSAPLGAASSGRLQFVRGAANVVLRVDSSIDDLYRARFDGPPPEVHARDGAVTIRYPRTFHPFDWRRRTAEVTLNPAIPWQIEFHGGASGVAVTLPRPSGTVSVRVTGGASDVTIHRPEGVAARIRVGRDVSELAFDEQRFGAIGGETRLQTPGYDGAADRYDVEVAGGASKLSVGTR
jgi:hypothetical protein